MTDKKATLVLCQNPDSPEQRIWTPPLTTPLLGEIMKARGWLVKLLDSRTLMDPSLSNSKNANEIANAILDTNSDLVGFSFLSANARLSESIALAIKQQRPELPLIAGGAHCTSAPEMFTSPYHVIVRGEADDVIADISNQLIKDGVPSEQKIVHAPIPNLKDSPVVVGAQWSPYNNIYQNAEYKTGYIQLGRGCPFSCSFCDSSNGQKTRARPSTTVLDEVRILANEFGVNYLAVMDSVALNTPGFKDTFASISALFDGKTIALNSTFVRFNEPMAKIIGAFNGEVTVWFGLETGSERLGRQELKGKWNKKATFQAIELCKQYGIKTGINCIFGFTDETQADREETISLLTKFQPNYPNPNILNPIPGTPLYNRYAQKGLLRDPMDLSIWSPDRIRTEQQGPILGVNYEEVHNAYLTVMNLNN